LEYGKGGRRYAQARASGHAFGRQDNVSKSGAAAMPSKLAPGQSADPVVLAKVRDANAFLDEAG